MLGRKIRPGKIRQDETFVSDSWTSSSLSLFSSSFVSMSKEKMMKEEKGRERHRMKQKKEEEERSVRRVHIGLALSFSNPSKDETEDDPKIRGCPRIISSSIIFFSAFIQGLTDDQENERRER